MSALFLGLLVVMVADPGPDSPLVCWNTVVGKEVVGKKGGWMTDPFSTVADAFCVRGIGGEFCFVRSIATACVDGSQLGLWLCCVVLSSLV